jgi:hypothetical protein
MPPRRLARSARIGALGLLLLAGAACVTENRPADCAEAAKTIEVTITADAMVPNDPAACAGQAVTLIVRSELDGVFHVHGLDEVLPAASVTQGADVTLEFSADRTGQFPIEVHPADDPVGVSVGVLTVHDR